ncbi:phosphatidate cytidylyltransferase [Spirochaeta lutea]|uniref:Phosphatidate cytidylyltransferase n=1 Tax=Spirochaeta lutea TaxID=1480694 RepID=A0A098QWM2_9SPIO|nr:phosphatidate cytidylyltransferase [Spirochaeta lutea]
MTVPSRRAELQIEVVRKSIHLLIGFVPMVATLIGVPPTLLLLGAGIILYTSAEYLRYTGTRVPLISRITELASRDRDKNHFVLGPVTLGLGAMLALMLYPEPAASIAIYALAFGDGMASLFGKAFGRIKLPLTGGKSLEGSLGCFLAVFIPTYLLVEPQVSLAIVIAAFAAFIEALPTRDFDNIVMPTVTGAFALLVL